MAKSLAQPIIDEIEKRAKNFIKSILKGLNDGTRL